MATPRHQLFHGHPSSQQILRQVLGMVLAGSIAREVHPKKVVLREIDCPGFEYLPLADKFPEIDVIDRKTSIAAERFIRLKSGPAIRLTVPKNCEEVAVVMNMRQTNASLVLTGAKTLVKRRDSRYFKPHYSPLTLVVWSLLNPVPVTHGVLELSCRPVNSAAWRNLRRWQADVLPAREHLSKALPWFRLFAS